MRLFGEMTFSRSFVPQSEAWEAFLRIDTSLLRAACWTMASGMRLAIHVKAQCGETRRFDWCCRFCRRLEPLVDPVFGVKKSLEVSSIAEQATRSWTSDVSFLECHHQRLPMVPFYDLITDRTETRCRFNAVWTLSGGCWCISLADLLLGLSSAACVMTMTLTRPLMNCMIIPLQSTCPNIL